MNPKEAIEVLDTNIERDALLYYDKETVILFDEAMKVLRELAERATPKDAEDYEDDDGIDETTGPIIMHYDLCPNCGKSLHSDSYCPRCGQAIKAKQNAKVK